MKTKSQKQESKVAVDMCGRVTLASGAIWTQKADVRGEHFLIECKTTEKLDYTLTIDTWKKIENEALRDNMRIPLMHIQILNGYYEFVVISKDDFIKLGMKIPANPLYPRIAGKSFRLRHDTLDKDIVINGKPTFIREDVVFSNKTHLVILLWEDFLRHLKMEE